MIAQQEAKDEITMSWGLTHTVQNSVFNACVTSTTTYHFEERKSFLRI